MPFRIHEVRLHDVDVPLHEPFGIATGAQVRAENLFVEVMLEGGTVGLGEAAPFPDVNGDTRRLAREEIAGLIPDLRGFDARQWRKVEALTSPMRSASARCAVEVAVFDAFLRLHAMPMWSFFGGASTELETDLTITTGGAAAAAKAASKIAADGYSVIKLKVGGASLERDLERLAAVTRAAPACELIIDANGGMKDAAEALYLLNAAISQGVRVRLFEQPLRKEDIPGLQELARVSKVPMALDESCNSVADVQKIAALRLGSVANIKLMKSGFLQGLRMVETARALGLTLMVGGMVESRLTMGVSACLAAGMGCFSHVDLDTPLWMTRSPVDGGYVQRGARMDLSGIPAGHGCSLASWTTER